MTPAGAARRDRRGFAVHPAVTLFVVFAFSYFVSAVLRGVTATLAPAFTADFGLTAGDLGLLAGLYFLGFASTQLPLGTALDRLGPKRVLIAMLALAVLGCAAFALARDFVGLALARTLTGIGVSACLMAPLTAFRRGFGVVAQLRANSWMLMSGSMGMVASTLPVQWLLPVFGWRGVFWAIAASLLVAIAAIARFVPRDGDADGPAQAAAPARAPDTGYARIWRNPTFLRFAPIGMCHYGGLIAVQSLWAGPWLVNVCGWSAAESAQGLFLINAAMLVTFMSWGSVVPRLYARGWTAQRLVARGAPLSIAALALALYLGPAATAWIWVVFCAACSVVSLSQPAVGMALPTELAGRALSAYNLLIFLGVFALQWGIGLSIDGLRSLGWDLVSAYRGGFALLLACCLLSYVWFLWRRDDPDTGDLKVRGRTADNLSPCPD